MAKKGGPSCKSIVNLQLGQKKWIQLQVGGGLATRMSKKSRVELQFDGGLASGIGKKIKTSCMSMVDLQLDGKNETSCKLVVDLQLGQ